MKTIIKQIKITFMLMSSLMVLLSCDEHETVDLGIHVGYVLCDDHRTMSIDTYESQHATKAVAVVFAEQTASHPTLAVMLDEISSVAYADTLGIEQGTGASLDAFDGWTNTVALHNSHDEKTGKGSPLADQVFCSHTFGQSDYVPSVAEMRLLVSALSIVNPVIERCGGTPLSIDSEDGGCWYWTSTEVNEDKANTAWLCSMVNGGILPTLKNERHPVRAIVALYY